MGIEEGIEMGKEEEILMVKNRDNRSQEDLGWNLRPNHFRQGDFGEMTWLCCVSVSLSIKRE